MEPKTPKPLRKLNIFVNCLTVLLLIVFAYIEFFGEEYSIYWKIGEFVSFFILIMTTMILRKVRYQESWGQIILATVLLMIYLCMVGSREITKYKNHLCTDKFGPEFNARRRSVGIPQIPANWHEHYIFGRSTTWEQKDSTIGHHEKSIYTDSTCAIESENDEYYLKPVKGKSSSMSIFTTYARGKSTDTISFRFYKGDSIRDLTRQQADSIFAAEKIQKDY